MSGFVDVETSVEALQEDKEVIEAIEKLGKATAEAAVKEFQPEIDAFLSTFEAWATYWSPILVEYSSDHERFLEDMEKLAFCAILFAIAFLMLAPWRRDPQQRKRNGWWFMKQDSMSTFHASPGGYDTDSKSTNETEDELDEVQRFEMQWHNLSMSRYSSLVLPPSCKLLEIPKQPKSTSAHQAMAKHDSRQSLHADDNPAQRLQTYWEQFKNFVGNLLTFNYMSAGTALMSWIQGIRQSRLTNLNDDDDNETTASLLSRVSEATGSVPETVSVTNNTSSSSSNQPVVSAHSVMNGKVESIEQPSPTPDPREDHVKGHAKRLSDLSTVFNESDLDDCEMDNEERQSSPLHAQQHIAARSTSKGKSKDALAAYRIPPRSTPARTRSSSFDASGILTEPAPPEPPESQRKERHGSAKHFFDTATTRDSLKRLKVDVGIPDKNGYLLGDEHLVTKKCTPLLVFVNSRAGPQQGHLLLNQLRRLLNPIQIWDLANGPPGPVLQSFSIFSKLRVLVCGGDGTVAWIMSALEDLELTRKWPPIAILPLGTGNDLARVHGWGGGYNNESLIGVLEQISESYVSLLDRWEVTIEQGKKKKKRIESKSFFNYLGVGADAQAALQVHYLRESKPEWFFSRLVNKAWYGVFGAEDILKATSVNVRKDITLIADGVQVPLPADSQGIIVLNIDSYAGGVPLWSHGVKYNQKNSPLVSALEQLSHRGEPELDLGESVAGSNGKSLDRVDSMDDLTLLPEKDRYAHVTSCRMPSSCQDGMLEIVSIRGAFHLGQIKVGLSNAQRLCQCKAVTIHLKHKVAVQVDGEPWRQSACTLVVKRKPQSATMLHRSADDGGVETVMSKLLDWAEERKLVDGQVHSILMKEFSRRVESHTRQKRTRAQDQGGLLSMQKLKRAMGSSPSVPSLSSQWPGGSGGNSF